MVEKVEYEEKCPAALATTFVSKESRGVRELRDILFPLDPEAKVVKTEFRDVLLIYTRLSREELKRVFVKLKPSSVARLFIADLCIILEDEKDIAKIIDSSVELFISKHRGSRFYVDCVKRGRFIDKCHPIEAEIGSRISISGHGFVDYKNPDVLIKIEVINRIVLISIIKPEEDRLRKRVI
ncbi:MAG: THUMP domain-containing protein [Sulfolobales archaeon]